MKPLLKTLVLCVALVVMTACSAQKRAQRKIRSAVWDCPELVQVKARPVDTVLTAPAFADVAVIPMKQILACDTVYAATPHGTVVVSLRQSDSALRAGFVAAPQRIHFHDTLHYAQVVVPPADTPESEETPGWYYLAAWILGAGIGIWIFAYLFKYTPNKKQ